MPCSDSGCWSGAGADMTPWHSCDRAAASTNTLAAIAKIDGCATRPRGGGKGNAIREKGGILMVMQGETLLEI